MNEVEECVWSFIPEVCDMNCEKCGKYISASDEQGRFLLLDYDKQLKEQLKPLYARWREIFDEYTID